MPHFVLWISERQGICLMEMKMVKTVQVIVTRFQSNDGKTYKTEIEALRADEAFRGKADHVFHFSRSYYGGQMLKKHQLAAYGIWRVEGEDPGRSSPPPIPWLF